MLQASGSHGEVRRSEVKCSEGEGMRERGRSFEVVMVLVVCLTHVLAGQPFAATQGKYKWEGVDLTHSVTSNLYFPWVAVKGCAYH